MKNPHTDSITDPQAIEAYLRSGCKERAAWGIGTEHEKFAFHKDTLRPIPYESPSDSDASIANFLRGMCTQDSEPYREGEHVLGCLSPRGSITLEPGGQIEFSSSVVETLHRACAAMHEHLYLAKRVAEPLNMGLLGVGFLPLWSRDDVPWMPKRRYEIMRQRMVQKGKLGIDMMKRTCTVQVNLDFDSEEMMVQCLRIGLALQPIVVALFANSPFTEGRLNGFLSYRSHVWTDTDPERCGILPFVFDDGFGFRRYVDYILDVPMYFIRREGTYYDVRGRSFRDFMAGKLVGFESWRPTLEDVKDHMSTIFTEVRLKTFVEMRGADGGNLQRLCALSAFWVGLLYDDAVRETCYQWIKDWSPDTHQSLRTMIPKEGLHMRMGSQTIAEIARDTLALAERGLKNRKRYNQKGQDESIFLEPLFAQVKKGTTPAEDIIDLWKKNNKSMEAIYQHLAY
ncbi:MAG: glutamate--cysteine ligase [Alphaproteobacteria bacterium GM202ARS2]|nr:glutamate--cysteine ligase [Alphaproteobacteria bacterium GM202ARS2]